ncbi:MAG TPA: sulfite exporter TauE/SafE family protein [Burkholderiales bacterium]|nr:sulfite exporter TauE/SafE family protein [Burkholderiales bacterium]
MTGFGSTVVALPLLAHLLPLKFAVAMLLLLDLTASLAVISRVRDAVRKDELARIVPFLLAGVGLGVTLLVKLPERPLLVTLGVFLLAYAAYCLAGRRSASTLAAAWAAPIGLVGGGFSALFGTGGVLLVVYFAGRLADKAQLRATTAAGILVSTVTRALLFGVTGLLAQEGVLLSALALLPAVLGGLLVGQRLHARVDASQVLRAVYLLLLISGLSLLLR